MRILIDAILDGKSLEEVLRLHSGALEKELSYFVAIDSIFVKPEDYADKILSEGQLVEILNMGHGG